MRIKYFGENKERGWGRVAVIRFTDKEFDLYHYIAKYENTYGDPNRKFSGSIFGIERDENGVCINESYINVDDFTDFNDFKANYMEAKKEFKSLKKHTTETETAEESKTEYTTATDPETIETETSTETKPEMTTEIEVDYDVDMHIKSEQHSYYWDSYTVKATTTDSAMDKALNRIMNEAGIDKTSIDSIRIYKSGEPEMLKEYCYEADEKIPDLNNFHNAIIKALGMTRTKEFRYTIQGVNVFFEYKGTMYKCYTPQSKLYKLSGQRFNRITWKDLKKESAEKSDDKSDDVYTARPPPESSLLNLSRKIN